MKFNRIIKIYPSHKNIDYVYYMRAVSYFEQISGENFDGKSNEEAKKKKMMGGGKVHKKMYAMGGGIRKAQTYG